MKSLSTRKPAPDASGVSRQEFRSADDITNSNGKNAPHDEFFKAKRKERRIPREVALMKKNIPAINVQSKYEEERARSVRQHHLTLPSIDRSSTGRVSSVLSQSAPAAASSARDAPASTAGSFRLPVIPSDAPVPTRPRTLPAAPKLPLLTFNTDRELDLSVHPPSHLPNTARSTFSRTSAKTKSVLSARSATTRPTSLSEYDGDEETKDTDMDELDHFHAALQRHVSRNERKELRKIDSEDDLNDQDDGRLSPSHTGDEEAASRVLKSIFHLNLTNSSNIIQRLKAIDPTVLQRRVAQELGPRKQVSKDEFSSLICKLLRDDQVNKRDCLSLFAVFDDDKSGMVDAVEFVGGFMSLIASGHHDISYKFLATLLEGREKLTVNAFISRFELHVLLEAAKHHYRDDEEIVALIDSFGESFRYEHHRGRMPISEVRSAILDDEDLKAIFTGLPNPVSLIRDAQSNAPREVLDDHDTAAQHNNAAMAAAHHNESDFMKSPHFEADKWISANADKQFTAEEHDSPVWTVNGETIYRRTKSKPIEEPIFMREK